MISIFKNKKHKVIGCIALCFAVFVSVALFLFSKSNKEPETVYAEEVVITDWSQAEGALLGDILEIPSSPQLKIDENTFVNPESAVLILPNGDAKDLKARVLDTLGIYTIRYFGEYQGTTIYGDRELVVREANYRLSSSLMSSATYKTAEEITYGEHMGSARASGIDLVLAKDTYFAFDANVNIYDIAKETGGMVDVCTIFPELDQSLKSDEILRYARWLTVKMIDSYDPSNFVEFYIWNNCQSFTLDGELYSERVTYGGAGASNQDFTALTDGNSNKVTVDGTTYGLRRAKRYVTSPFGVYVTGDTKSYYEGGIKFRYDVNKNQAYCGKTLLTDLDDENIYGDNVFKGFTTGEVYFQFEVKLYSASVNAINMQITSIADISGEDLQKTLKQDVTCPMVSIDVDYMDEGNKTVNIVTGESFTLPQATVYDVNGNGTYKVALYSDYHTDNPKLVNLKDNKFTPQYAGAVYTAVYVAEDRYGNKNVDEYGKCLDIVNFVATDSKKFTYDKNSKITQLDSAIDNILPYIDVQAVNEIKDIQVIVIDSKGQEYFIQDSYDGNGYHFTPVMLGEYQIKYVFRDNVYEETFSYNVNCVDTEAVIFEGNLAIPKVFIKDATYVIPDYYGYKATADGLQQQKATIFVSVDGGDYEEIANQYEYIVSGNNELSFKAKVDEQYSQAFDAQIVDVNYAEDSNVNDGLKIYKNYFVGYDTANVTDENIGYSFEPSEKISLDYATPLVFEVFSFEFEIPEAQKDVFNNFSITLTGISKDVQGYTLAYKQEGKRLFLKVTDANGKTYYDSTVTGSLVGRHSISVAENNITFGEGVTVAVDKLQTEYVNFGISIDKPTNGCEFNVISVCKNIFCRDVFELPAELVYKASAGGVRIGSDYELPTFRINSPFYPMSRSRLTYSYVDAQGNVLVDVNGNQVKDVKGDSGAVTINLADNTRYFLEFRYENFNNEMNVMDNGGYTITPNDVTPPVIAFVDEKLANYDLQMPVSTVHMIKEFTVVDANYSREQLEVVVMIVDTFGGVVAWDIGDSYCFDMAGDYEVVVFAQDVDNNASIASYRVKVV